MPDATERTEAVHTGTLVSGLTRLWRNRTPVAVSLPLVARVLAARGITGDEASRLFLEPSLKQLHEPSLMPDLDRAADRLLAAARSGEPIVIYGDYDVDGISATAILYHTLLAVAPGAKVSTYVPHRLEEGYGLNVDAIAELAAAGARVIVSVDCGVTAIDPARVAAKAGIDLIITDHHNLAAELPAAFAVVHPRLPGSAYPFGDLCGAAVAFKLAWRLATMSSGSSKVSEPLRDLLLELLALASLGVIADVVPLRDENRVIARFGLSRIKYSRLEGLRALVEASGLGDEKVEAEDVGFKLGPRLNACGRMGHAREAVELLTTARGSRAIEIAEQLTRLNDQRRATEREIFEQAVEQAEQAGMTRPETRAIVLSCKGWHAGVVGIVCSRLVERFHRPTILLCENEGVCHGSGRSVEGFDLFSAIARCSAGLLSFGGHDMAAGLKVLSPDFPAFRDAFIGAANEGIAPEMLVGRASYDTDAELSELSLDAVTQLRRLAPFGRDNPPVTLRLPRVRVVGRPETMGKLNKHMTLRIGALGPGGRVLRVVGWNWADRIASVGAGMNADVLIRPQISEWNGTTSVEGELVDLRPL